MIKSLLRRLQGGMWGTLSFESGKPHVHETCYLKTLVHTKKIFHDIQIINCMMVLGWMVSVVCTKWSRFKVEKNGTSLCTYMLINGFVLTKPLKNLLYWIASHLIVFGYKHSWMTWTSHVKILWGPLKEHLPLPKNSCYPI